MALNPLVRTTTVLAALAFLSAVESARCAETQMNVASAADARNLSDALNCTGGGDFSVTWYGSVTISQAFEVTDGISLTVTGSGASSMALGDGIPYAGIVGNELTPEAGIFFVSGASTLTLDNMALQGAYSEKRDGGGAIEAQGSRDAHPTINVIDCLFADNFGYWAGMRRFPMSFNHHFPVGVCSRPLPFPSNGST